MRRGSATTRVAAALALAVLAGGSGCAVSRAEIPQLLEPARLVGAPTALDSREVYLEQRIAAMTIEQKVAALVMVHVPGTDPARIRTFVDAHGFGGVILMGDNIGGPAATVSTLT
ncbi:MAG: glycoside hydrolase family 3 protein, partial [Microcella sp.]|nr:glycoside hydrolase family 3 protein [Microcella sp.]